jgi:hypothetical protein
MPVLKGNTTGSIFLVAYNIPSTIRSYIISNKASTSVSVTVYLTDTEGVSGTAISAVSYSLSVGQAYIRDIPIKVKPNSHIYIVASGSVDYYFSID